ncbi:MAG: hypothetical protein WBB44_01685 [Candidatus Nanopelagicales bacterium]|nr:hypothetical protein [Candidatus Nanopelagicales bacterium]
MSSANSGAPAAELPAEPAETLTVGQRARRAWCMVVKAAGATFGIY